MSDSSLRVKIQGVWVIEHFAEVLKSAKPGEYVSSPAYRNEHYPGTQFLFILFPDGEGSEGTEGKVSMALLMKGSPKKSTATRIDAKFCVGFASAEESAWSGTGSGTGTHDHGDCCLQEHQVHTFTGCNPTWECHKLEKDTFREALRKDGALALRFEIEFPEFEGEKIESARAIRILRNLYEDEAVLSDFVVVVNGEQIPVHRNILAQSSAVFRGMVTTTDFGNERSAIFFEVEDTTNDAAKAMLQFMYAEPITFEKQEKLAADVLALADKYDIPELKELCHQMLCDMVSETNFTRMLSLAKAHQCENLMKTCKDFVCRNSDLLKTEQWIKFKNQNSKVAVDVAEAVIDHLKGHSSCSSPSKSEKMTVSLSEDVKKDNLKN